MHRSRDAGRVCRLLGAACRVCHRQCDRVFRASGGTSVPGRCVIGSVRVMAGRKHPVSLHAEGYFAVCVPGAVFYPLYLADRHDSGKMGHEPAGDQRLPGGAAGASGRGLPGNHRAVSLQPVCGDRLYYGRRG